MTARSSYSLAMRNLRGARNGAYGPTDPGGDWKSLPVLDLAIAMFLFTVSHLMKVGGSYSLGRAAVLLAMCSLITLYGCIRNPYTPFYCFMCLTPIFSAMGTTIALVLGGTVAILLNHKKCQWSWTFSPAGLAFCLWMIASLGWAGTLYLGEDGFLLQTLPSMVFAVVIAGIKDPIFRRNVVLLLVLPCVLGCVASFRNWATGRIPEYGYGRTYSLIAPDMFSAWLLCGSLGALAWMLAGRLPSIVRGALGLCLPIMLIGLGLCGFRAAILALAVGIIVISLCKKPLVHGVLITGVIALTIFVIYALDPDMFSKVLTRFQVIGEDRGSGRYDIWQAGLLAFADSPVMGVGIDNFRLAVVRYLGQDWAAHSIYIGTLVELGTVGLALLCLWIGTLLRKAWRSPDRLLVFPLIVVYLFQGAFLHEFQFACFWLAIGLTEGSRPMKWEAYGRSHLEGFGRVAGLLPGATRGRQRVGAAVARSMDCRGRAGLDAPAVGTAEDV